MNALAEKKLMMQSRGHYANIEREKKPADRERGRERKRDWGRRRRKEKKKTLKCQRRQSIQKMELLKRRQTGMDGSLCAWPNPYTRLKHPALFKNFSKDNRSDQHL